MEHRNKYSQQHNILRLKGHLTLELQMYGYKSSSYHSICQLVAPPCGPEALSKLSQDVLVRSASM